jgi:hypothetical protein
MIFTKDAALDDGYPILSKCISLANGLDNTAYFMAYEIADTEMTLENVRLKRAADVEIPFYVYKDLTPQDLTLIRLVINIHHIRIFDVKNKEFEQIQTRFAEVVSTTTGLEPTGLTYKVCKIFNYRRVVADVPLLAPNVKMIRKDFDKAYPTKLPT